MKKQQIPIQDNINEPDLNYMDDWNSGSPQSEVHMKFTAEQIINKSSAESQKQQMLLLQGFSPKQNSFQQSYELHSPLKSTIDKASKPFGLQDMLKNSYTKLQEDKKENHKNKSNLRTATFLHPSSGSNTQLPTKQILLETLKAPLEIDLNRLTNKKHNFPELSKDLYVFAEKRWERCQLSIDFAFHELLFNNLQVSFSSISKLKIFKPKPNEGLNEVKVTYEKAKGNQEEVFLNSRTNRQIKRVPYQFLIFVEILVHKLKFQNRYKETKWEKSQHIDLDVIFGSYIFGQIYKKSQNFKNWQKRYVVANSKGFFSYKDKNKKEEHSFCIMRSDIKYIWTRFCEFDGFLIIKIKHGIKKTEFGIPLVNYSYAHNKNWLFYFFRLLMAD